MIDFNRNYGEGVKDFSSRSFSKRNLLRPGKKKILIYGDKECLEENPRDSTAYVLDELVRHPERYEVKVSYDRNASITEWADIVFSRFDPLKDSEGVENHRKFLESLVQYEGGRDFYNAPNAQLKFGDKRYLKDLIGSEILVDSLFTKDPQKAVEFMRYLGTGVFVKPIFGFGGKGIERFGPEDYDRAGDYVNHLLRNGQDEVFVQRSIEEVLTLGDKRIIVVNGKPIGAILRKPVNGSYISNICSGGRKEISNVSQRDLRVIESAMKYLPELRKGWWGLDIIGDYLGEANGNSPGLGYALDEYDSSYPFKNSIIKSIDESGMSRLVA